MLKDEFQRRQRELEAEVAYLEQKMRPLEEDLKKKREMLQHYIRLAELEDGNTAQPQASKAITSQYPKVEPSAAVTTAKSASTCVPIFVVYKGIRYDAELDRSRIHGDRGMCVWFRNEWVAPSAAGNSIPTRNLVNGWRFWRYNRKDGSIGMIDEFRAH